MANQDRLGAYGQPIPAPSTHPYCHGCDYCHRPSPYPELGDDGQPIMNFVMPYPSWPTGTSPAPSILFRYQPASAASSDGPINPSVSSGQAVGPRRITLAPTAVNNHPVRSQVAAPRRLLPAPTAVNNHPVRSQVAAPRRLLPAPTRNIPAIQGQAAGRSVARASTTNPPVPSSNIDPALTASSANFMCKNCGGRFATAANLRSHRWQVYGELVSPTRSGFVQPSQQNNPVSCPFSTCDGIFPSQEQMKRHIWRYHGFFSNSSR